MKPFTITAWDSDGWKTKRLIGPLYPEQLAGWEGNRPWEPAEDAYLISARNLGMTAKEIAWAMDRDTPSIYHRARKLGIAKCRQTKF